MCPAASPACARDRPSRYGDWDAFFFVVRGPVPRDLSLILAILSILAILLQPIAIKVLSDLSLLFLLISIDIQVLSDLVVRFWWYAIAARRGR